MATTIVGMKSRGLSAVRHADRRPSSQLLVCHVLATMGHPLVLCELFSQSRRLKAAGRQASVAFWKEHWSRY